MRNLTDLTQNLTEASPGHSVRIRREVLGVYPKDNPKPNGLTEPHVSAIAQTRAAEALETSFQKPNGAGEKPNGGSCPAFDAQTGCELTPVPDCLVPHGVAA